MKGRGSQHLPRATLSTLSAKPGRAVPLWPVLPSFSSIYRYNIVSELIVHITSLAAFQIFASQTGHCHVINLNRMVPHHQLRFSFVVFVLAGFDTWCGDVYKVGIRRNLSVTGSSGELWSLQEGTSVGAGETSVWVHFHAIPPRQGDVRNWMTLPVLLCSYPTCYAFYILMSTRFHPKVDLSGNGNLCIFF